MKLKTEVQIPLESCLIDSKKYKFLKSKKLQWLKLSEKFFLKINYNTISIDKIIKGIAKIQH